jgi:hypothetical protein
LSVTITARYVLQALQQPSKEAFGRLCVPPWLNEDVEHDAVLIHGTPKITLHALNPDEHLIQMPLVTGPRTTAAQAFGKALAKFLAPAPNGLIGDDDATLGQQELNIPQAEAEHVIQPDSMADDLGGKAMAVARVGRGLHGSNLASLKPDCQTRLT